MPPAPAVPVPAPPPAASALASAAERLRLGLAGSVQPPSDPSDAEMGLSEDGGCDCAGDGCAECMDGDGWGYRRGRRVWGSYDSDQEGSWSDLPCDDYPSLQYFEREAPLMAPKKCNYVAKPDPAREPNLMKLADIKFVCEATGENTISDLVKRIAPYGFFEGGIGITPCLGDRYVLCSLVGEWNRENRKRD